MSARPVDLRNVRHADIDAILAMNARYETETAPLDEAALLALLQSAFRARMAWPAGAFYIALDEGSAVQGPNFQWFASRYTRFIYLDRIIVPQEASREGLGTRLYADLIEAAIAARHTVVCCEVNVSPPNPRSLAFHRKLGFLELATAQLPDRKKTVCYLVLDLAAR